MNITRRINRKRWAVPVATVALLLLSTVPIGIYGTLGTASKITDKRSADT